MSNTNRPTNYADCDHGARCTGCGCSECGALETGTLGPLELPSGRIVQACKTCREGEAEEETVETPTLSDADLLALKMEVA